MDGDVDDFGAGLASSRFSGEGSIWESTRDRRTAYLSGQQSQRESRFRRTQATLLVAVGLTASERGRMRAGFTLPQRRSACCGCSVPRPP